MAAGTRQSAMDSFDLEDLRRAVELSSVCIGVFNEKTSCITEPNQALRNRLDHDEAGVDIVATDDDRVYGRLKIEEIPVSLRILTGKDGCSLVEVSLAHTTSARDKSATSDLIQLVDTTSDGVWEWFPSLQYEFMSARFWGNLGYDHKEMPNTHDAWMGIINPTDLAKAMKMFNDHVATKGVVDYHCNIAYTHKDGHEVSVKSRGAVVEWLPDGVPWRMLGTVTDITSIKKASEAKAQLVLRLSHEIRTPICAILNECEALETSNATSTISDSCEQLLALCNDMLTVDKLHGLMEMAAFKHSTEVEDFFQKFVRRHAIQATKKGLTLESKVGRVPSAPLMMDVSKCNQVVDNLASNAIKFTPKRGHLHLELNCWPPKAPTVAEDMPSSRLHEISMPNEAQKPSDQWRVEVTVRDTGKGIHEDDKEFVFTKFSQANAAMEGAGLGLAISKELAVLMSGDVFLKETKVGEGSTFTFCFPAAIDPLAADRMTPAARGESIANGKSDQRLKKGSTLRILSADDMLTNRKVMRRRLRAIEEEMQDVTMEVVDAVDGNHAVSMFRDAKGNFDLIFMDCLMPGLDGFEASKQIRLLCEELDIEAVPIVAVTASVSLSLHQKCRGAGMWRVITKPFAAMDVIPILQAVIDAQKEDEVESPTHGVMGEDEDSTSTDRGKPVGHSPCSSTLEQSSSGEEGLGGKGDGEMGGTGCGGLRDPASDDFPLLSRV